MVSDGIHDCVLGPLGFDAALNQLSFRARFRARRVWIHLSLDRCDDLASLLGAARRVAARVEDLERAAAAAVSERLACWHRSSWPVPEAAPLTIDAGEFRRRFELESVLVHPDGQASLLFDEGVLFQGRVIQVLMRADGTFGGSIEAA